MALFFISHTEPEKSSALEERLDAKGIACKLVNPGNLLASSAELMTPKDVYHHLDIKDGEFGQILIVHFNSYWGYHESSVWEWIQKQPGKTA